MIFNLVVKKDFQCYYITYEKDKIQAIYQVSTYFGNINDSRSIVTNVAYF